MSDKKKSNPFENLDEENNLTRKKFLKKLAATGAACSALPAIMNLECASQRGLLKPSPKPKLTGGFEDRFRNKWTWDDAVRNTHNLNCWFQQNCSFHTFIKDGKVIREEQTGDYPQTNPDVPDFNPRGCQKGCTYSNVMYSKPRLTKPLKRIGKRGEGNWKEITWDQALGEIADKLVDIIVDEGPETIVVDPGSNIVSYVGAYSMYRFFDVIDATVLDINCELGDDQQGAALTYGEITSDRSGDDYFYSDLILIWGGNPAYTQIPNFHFLTEARYNGTEIISISPDLNASAIHADHWIPIKPGTDAALANAMAHVIIKEKLFDEHLIKEQTDLPYLVQVDNKKLLRESDLVAGGSETTLYRWDLKTNRLDKPGTKTLALDKVDPALTGTFKIKTRHGVFTVRPVFEYLKEELEKFTPEKAEELCGVAPETIRLLARKMAKAKAVTNTCTSSLSKYYHGDLMMRSIILVFLLTGHLGKKGDGYVSASVLVPDGVSRMVFGTERAKEMRLDYAMRFGMDFWRDAFKTGSVNHAAYNFALKTYADSRAATSSTLFWNIHGGLLENNIRKYDPSVKKSVKHYVDFALDKKWQVLEPSAEKSPKAFFAWGGNSLRRVRGADKLIKNLWPKLDLVVTADVRMSTTALYSDYILPVAGAYEKTTSMFTNSNPTIPFLHTTQKAVANVGQSKDEWEIACLLAKKIQQISSQKKKTTYINQRNKKRYLDRVYDYLSFEYDENDAEELTSDMIEESTNLGGISFKKMKEKGYVRFSSLGNNPTNWGNACDIKQGETISPHTWHTEKKELWMTLSGRIQFYIDHDWYIEMKECLPMYKPPLKSGGDYPITLTGGHTRWSIHAMWRTDPTLLRLQHGAPVLFISHEDATKRNIKNYDRVKVYNDVGDFKADVKISAKVRPGQAIMYHAWESFQFEDWKGYRNVLASPLKPLELVGDYPYMQPNIGVRQPGQSDRDTRVNFKKA